jgi:5-methyltetrahydropteroyltriglutamate--homocysteine methyltransferase
VAAKKLHLYPAERVFLNPDCGFGTFSNRPVNSAEIAYKKLRAIVEAARSW